MDYTIREYRLDDPEDARKLAKMWNNSDSGWPEGFTQGVPFTGERIADKMKNSARLAVYVAEYGDEIVGYCDLQADKGQSEVAYIPLLNACPAYHGKGIGKSLIRACLQKTMALGYKQLTLGTWAGNLKAVPLYKKTGFFWRPDTNVWMQNFIPTALTLPAARPYFEKHDWYRTFRRDLEVRPDEIEWHGIQVYPYAWEEDGDCFRMVVDKEAESVTAIETPEFSAACILGRDRLAAGLQGVARWEIENRTDRPLPVGLIATADEGIAIHVQESVTVEKRAVLERAYRLDALSRPSDGGRPSPKIRSTLLIQGMPVSLESGIRIVPPVEIQLSGWGMRVGREEKIAVRLKSNLDFPVEGRLLLESPPDIRFDRHEAAFAVEAKSWSGAAFRGTALAPGASYPALQAVLDRASDEAKAGEAGFAAPLKTRPKTVTLRGLETGRVVASLNTEQREAVLESDTLALAVEIQGGWMSLTHRIRGQRVAGQSAGALGPPFNWNEHPPVFPARIEQEGGKASIVLTMPSEDDPRITVEKTFTLSAGPVVEVNWRVINNSEAPYKGRLRVSSQAGAGATRITLPLKDGFVSEPVEGWGSFPMGDADLPRSPDILAESWVAWEQKGHTMGFVWRSCAEQEFNGGGAEFDLEIPEVAPQSSRALEPFHIVATAGGWEDIRRFWAGLTRPGGIREDRKPAVHRVQEIVTEPSPLMTLTDTAEGIVRLFNRRNKVANGTLTLQADGLGLDSGELPFREVKAGSPFSHPVAAVFAQAAPRAVGIRAYADTGLTAEEKALPCLKLGDLSQPVGITEEEGVYTVRNGWMCYRVAPGFIGSVISLETDGVNHLRSRYPEAGPFVWFNPWHGGLHPSVGHLWESRINRERFTGEPLQAAGKQGFVWNGIRVRCDLKHKDWQWLRLEADYLTLPGSNILAVVIRGVNKTPAPMAADLGAALWCQPGGSYDRSVTHYERDGQPLFRRRSDYSLDQGATHWAAIQNPSTGDTLLLVNTAATNWIEIGDCGREGAHPAGQARLAFEPNETREILLWLVCAGEMEQVRLYTALKDVPELP
ncbi:MAG: GNAT family N-acetyltransferase [Armatimonadetes bacterium]|nr:GNAT family N-acetyltransferase [Armatimonadota bacterium]